jgi:phosphoglucan,water dikinase
MNDNKILFMNFITSCDETKPGEDVYVTGDINSLGNWEPNRAIKLGTDRQSFPIWKSKPQEIECVKEKLEYKYLIKSNGNHVRWENLGSNRVINIKEIENMAKHSIEYTVEIKDDKFNEFKIPKISIGNFKENIIEIMETANLTKQIECKIEEEKHTNLEKFQIPKYKISGSTKDLIDAVFKGNQENSSWKDKLEFIYDFIKDREELDTQNLSIVYIYLFYINSGQIKCSENGTHFRPNHHANIAYSIFSYLLENLNDNNSILIRAILKNLPSFANQFTTSVPLTRIRDIAHRNDIDHGFKQEIKNKLQNKLHRSASPDDLKTCEYFINKITAQGANYSPDFVNEFKIFYEELKEFFNSLGLEKSFLKLSEISMFSSNHPEVISEISKFLHAKREGIEKSLWKLESLTKLRQSLQEIIGNELRKGDSCNKSILQLASNCEIGLEDYAYVVISEYLEKYFYNINDVPINEFNKLITVCNYSLDNFILSNIRKEECGIIKEDMINFSIYQLFEKNKDIGEEHRLIILKMKSIFERCLNLFYEIAEDINNYFSVPAYEIGDSFKINPHTVRVFSESFVRAHIMFQFSKVITLLLNKIREILKLPPYVVISTGQAFGYCLHLEKLSDFIFDSNPNSDKRFIVFLKQSDGSEEIPNGITAIVLSHDLPQLSHLAIRARQNRTVFICCLDNNTFKYDFTKKYKEGEWLSMWVKGDQQIIINKEAYKEKKIEKNIKELQEDTEEEEVSELEEELSEDNSIIPIEDAEKSTCGSKCANIRSLNNLKNKEYPYDTPQSLAITYHVFNAFSKKLITSNHIDSIDKCPFEEIEKKSFELRENFINGLMSLNITVRTHENVDKDVFELITEYINENLPNECFLAIRSSSNMEDLKKSAGAGLFDSYLGAHNTPHNLNEIKFNIAKVWASIFNHRALLARRNSKVTSKHAKMSILVQEMVNLDYSFVIHTINPITNNNHEVYIEMAVGLGETLASPKQRGSPYRMIYNKEKNTVEILNYASFSYYIKDGIENVFIKYRNLRLSTDDDYLKSIGISLGRIGVYLENSLDRTPQDIEGGILNDKIYLMQTRPQII